MSRVWFTDKLLPSSGSFDTEWRWGSDANPADHAATETDAVTADSGGELWVYRDSSWRPVSKLGLYTTAVTNNSASTLATPCVGFPVTTDIVSATPQTAVQNNPGQIDADSDITLSSSGVWLVWLYVYWATPTDTAPELYIKVGATTVAHQVYDQATRHAAVSGLWLATSSGADIEFSYGSTEKPTAIRTVTAKLSDYEA